MTVILFDSGSIGAEEGGEVVGNPYTRMLVRAIMAALLVVYEEKERTY